VSNVTSYADRALVWMGSLLTALNGRLSRGSCPMSTSWDSPERIDPDRRSLVSDCPSLLNRTIPRTIPALAL
jgi:hypothetical protein